MKKEHLKSLYVKAATDVADKFYPKGVSERRGEFIRDTAVLWVNISNNLDEYVKGRKKKPIAMRAVMMAEDIVSYFEEEKEGILSDYAWYDLIMHCEALLNGTITKKSFADLLMFTYGFNNNKEIATLRQKIDQRFENMSKIVNGESIVC